MASSEGLLGCVLMALLGGCTLLTSADDHKDGTGTDMGPSDAFVADAGDDDDLGVDEDMGTPDDMGPPDMTAPVDMQVDMFVDGGIQDCGGVGDLNGGSLVAGGIDAYDVTDFTLELWYRPTAGSLSGNRNIFGRWGVNEVSGSYALFMANGEPAVALSCDGTVTRAFQSTESLTADTWVHLAGTFNASTRRVRLFVDGVSVVDDTLTCDMDDTPPNPLGTTADLVLGYDDPAGGAPAEGLVDEARLSRSVRYTEGFAMDVPLTFVNDGSTLALYQFEDAALPATDESDNDNSLTNTGAAGLATACRP